MRAQYQRSLQLRADCARCCGLCCVGPAFDAELAARMFDAYYRYRGLHELMAILEVAIERASAVERPRLREVLRFIDDLCESGAAMAETLAVNEMRKDVLSRVRAALGAGLSVTATDDTLNA